MASYTVVIEGGQITTWVEGVNGEDDAFAVAVTKIREALKDVKGIHFSPQYRKCVSIEQHDTSSFD